MKAYLLESGDFEKGSKDLTMIFEDEMSALRYCIRRYGIKNLKRDNPLKTKGFRGKWIGRKRWVLLTEHRLHKSIKRGVAKIER